MGQSIVFMFWLDAESSKISVLQNKKGVGMEKKKKKDSGALNHSKKSIDQGSILSLTVKNSHSLISNSQSNQSAKHSHQLGGC